jgi:WD40 repeat protein
LMNGHENDVSSLDFSPDGSILASGSWDGTIRLWDVSKGQPICEPLRGHHNLVTSIAFSPDGSVLASASFNNTIRLWETSTGQQIGEPLQGHEDRVLCVAFSPDGSVLVSGSHDNTIRLWDPSTGQQIGEGLPGHTSEVNSVAFSPDGLILVSAGGSNYGEEDGERTIRLWDVSTRQPIGEPLRGHEDGVKSVAFSPDGSVLASGSSDGTIRLWHAVPLRERIDAIRARQAELQRQAETSPTQTIEP